MSQRNWLLLTVVGCLALSLSPSSQAAHLHVAVASNFIGTLNQLATGFKQHSGHNLIISSGSTGQLFAQIKQGAPYDVFMAADTHRPQLLIDQGLASQLHVYARGQLVLLVNRQAGFNCQSALNLAQLKYLAIANPDLAPYGLAAKQYLQNNQLWQQLAGRMVMGENVSQAMHMVVSKNATAGLVALSLLANHQLTTDQCKRLIALEDYQPINQAMVLLHGSRQADVYREFLQFLNSESAMAVLHNNGYLVDAEL